MSRAIQLARNAYGRTSPNPHVGAVITYNDQIIGEGFHKRAGKPHAEPEAINSVKNKSLLEKSTLYVTLEPCNHQGKTPACTELILKYKIPRVFIGMVDPHKKVAGKGIQRLKENGVEVYTGILNDECRKLNPVFITNHVKKRPYVMLKWAQTKNGFIDVEREFGSDQKPQKITGKDTAVFTHKLRAAHDAIMVGYRTAHLDNPRLLANLWDRNHPVRVTFDKELQLPENLNIFKPTQSCIVFTCEEKESSQNVTYITLKKEKRTPENYLKELFSRGISSVFIEGGTTLLQSFIDAELWDEAYVYTGLQEIETGVKAPHFQFSPCSTKILSRDSISRFIHPNNCIAS